MSAQQTSSSGVTLLGLVFIVFLTLKLCGVITWSWWWVTAPLWGGVALVALIALIGCISLGVGLIVHMIKNKK